MDRKKFGALESRKNSKLSLQKYSRGDTEDFLMMPERDNSPHRLFDNKSYFLRRSRESHPYLSQKLLGTEDKENMFLVNGRTFLEEEHKKKDTNGEHLCRRSKISTPVLNSTEKEGKNQLKKSMSRKKTAEIV